ncbi:L-threonine aldolase [Gemmobacter aquatilis]|uniref:L-threonine aldolase n=1 Tax=Gemmobacter aquatilis TaxID=933059 RepID=A0A1H8J429_9RHOB|nr:beta-eliminating lyase-related protein [Gemmobacter aquatilis]SEN75371.1 L-threonine aldolase [Gemmobacter aquatilis]
MFFASDNTAPCPPEVLAALAAANDGYARGYGADPLTARATEMLREVLNAPQAVVHLVATGTAANALSLASFCPPWGAVFCHTHAHIAEDECGAPEFFTHGAKLVHVGGAHGRMAPAALAHALANTGESGVHGVQRGMVSLTNVTEAGTVYSAAETTALATLAKAKGLPVHLDGARFANAVVATGATPAALTAQAGVDVLSFGGTKNGLMGVEAVVIFAPDKGWEFELRRKRAGHLVSKSRYLAAQMVAMLEQGRWLAWAAQANAMAALLAEGLAARGISLGHPVDANILFPHWEPGTSARLRAAGAQFYDAPAPEGREGARLVTSWATTEADVAGFLAAL